MNRFVEGEDRAQQSLLPASLDDYVGEENSVRVVDVYVEELDLAALGFHRVRPKATGRPAYHPSTPLKIYLYGYLNRIQSSRRLEREARRNLELMWLTGPLAPDFKTIADFRKDNGPAIQAVCARFIGLCRDLGLFARAVAAIDGAKFKAVNARDRNFTKGKLMRRIGQVEQSIERYLQSLDAADLQEDDVADGRTLHAYWTTTCGDCALKGKCTPAKERVVRRWEHEAVIDAMLDRLDRAPDCMTIRRRTVEHPFGTLKAWMGHTHFLTKGLEKVKTEMSLSVLAYNLKRMIAILGVKPLIAAIRA
ncbi:transposase [Defluviicoccus vanus]|uniref:Transposase n=1 Tax=Defluviicoccus vanus TaxID=111831 RepID=A0A7H1N6I7_9PROT|nr:transposase [Defluviicoccus vanus]QNT71323.1 transposase [Defluviicoccus vanus]